MATSARLAPGDWRNVASTRSKAAPNGSNPREAASNTPIVSPRGTAGSGRPARRKGGEGEGAEQDRPEPVPDFVGTKRVAEAAERRIEERGQETRAERDIWPKAPRSGAPDRRPSSFRKPERARDAQSMIATRWRKPRPIGMEG